MVDKDVRTEIATTKETNTDVAIDEKKESVGSGEVYCTSCGQTIKEAAEICPHCGVRQKGADTTEQRSERSGLSEHRQYELEKIASKSTIGGMLLGLFFPPVGYGYVGKWEWMIVNIFTLNYFFLGFILVPLHIWKMISDAKGTLLRAGIGGF